MASKFAVYNEIQSVTTDSENALYPASNILLNPTYKEYRATTTEAALIFDLGTARTVDTLFFCGNNATGELPVASFTLKANATDSGWDTPAYESSLHTLTTDQLTYNLVHLAFTERSFRYWRLEISNPGGEYTGLSSVYLGSHVTLPVDIGYTFARRSLSKVSKGRYGQRFVDKINTIRTFECSMSALNKEERDLLSGIFDYCDIDTPFWLYLDTDDSELQAGYFYFESIGEFENIAYRLYNSSFDLEENI
ncbi:MAG: hypothetical protein ACOH5I_21870 [Oligoflexus sp.]